jgi:hypothetical protein
MVDLVADPLMKGARDFSQSALRAYVDSDWPVFFLHASTALEHMAKHALVRRHPSLIAADKDYDALLHRRTLADRFWRPRRLAPVRHSTVLPASSRP